MHELPSKIRVKQVNTVLNDIIMLTLLVTCELKYASPNNRMQQTSHDHGMFFFEALLGVNSDKRHGLETPT